MKYLYWLFLKKYIVLTYWKVALIIVVFVILLIIIGMINKGRKKTIKKLKENLDLTNNKLSKAYAEISKQTSQLREKERDIANMISEKSITNTKLIQAENVKKALNEKLIEQKTLLDEYNLQLNNNEYEKLALSSNLQIKEEKLKD